MWGYMGHDGWGGMGFGMLLFWGLLIAGIVMLLRCSGGCGKPKHRDSALDILKQRYTRGEIGKEEFEEKKRDLEN